jgi:hypothetical protein
MAAVSVSCSPAAGSLPLIRRGLRLRAYNFNQGTIKWQVNMGEVPELAANGFKNTGSHFPKVGPVVTAAA